ncbi:MAG TPA: MarR family transcriptional regulator [Gammaproteobacteria bacterium]|nr:MarR family transcriptional regulator [Gammaproteobacteria bacterium]
MSNDQYGLAQMRQHMKENWQDAVTPAGDLVTFTARLRDLFFTNDRPAIAAHELTTAEFDVLVTLRKMPPPYELTPTALRKSSLITSGGLTKVLHLLEDKQLVERTIDRTDRRIKRVKLTQAGVQKAEQSLTAVLAMDAELLNQVISKQDLENLNALLFKLLVGVEAQVQRS